MAMRRMRQNLYLHFQSNNTIMKYRLRKPDTDTLCSTCRNYSFWEGLSMTVIEAKHLTKRYDNGVTALENLDLSVERGEVFGFFGPNGAGKTTTVRLLNGTLSPTSGESKVLGLSSRDDEIRKKTATLTEMAAMYESMTVMENLGFFADLYEMDPADAGTRIRDLLERMELGDKKDFKLGSFSTGMKKRVQLIRSLLHRPEVIFLDEPAAGLDPAAAQQVNDLIRKLAREEGTTIFMCTHNLYQADKVCDTFGFLKMGRLAAYGKKEDLIQSVIREKKILVKTDRQEHSITVDSYDAVNGHVRKIMDSGEHILEVLQVRPSLEEVYFHYLGRQS